MGRSRMIDVKLQTRWVPDNDFSRFYEYLECGEQALLDALKNEYVDDVLDFHTIVELEANDLRPEDLPDTHQFNDLVIMRALYLALGADYEKLDVTLDKREKKLEKDANKIGARALDIIWWKQNI